MRFRDIDPMHLPQKAIYYHNVTVICMKGDKDLEYWDLSHINDARPFVLHCYPEATKAEVFEHAVVEVHPTLGICFYLY